MAIQLPDGRLYYTLPGWSVVVLFLFFALIGSLFFGLGLLLLPLVYSLAQMNWAEPTWSTQGGIEIKK